MQLPGHKQSINQENWPELIDLDYSLDEKEQMEMLISAIQAVREIKNEYHLKPSAELWITLKTQDGELAKLDEHLKTLLSGMAHASIADDLHTDDVLQRTISHALLEVAMNELIDLEEEKAKWEKEIKKLNGEVMRGEKMLSNPNFVNKAPAQKVEAESKKLKTYKEQLQIAQDALAQIMEKMHG